MTLGTGTRDSGGVETVGRTAVDDVRYRYTRQWTQPAGQQFMTFGTCIPDCGGVETAIRTTVGGSRDRHRRTRR